MERTNETCEERIRRSLCEEVDVIRKLWDLEKAGDENGDPDHGTLNEYGLCFDYVAAGTFNLSIRLSMLPDPKTGYFLWQLSTGGPGDEFRFYCDPAFSLDRVEYVFLDWYDGATVKLDGADLDLLREIWENYFREVLDLAGMVAMATK